MRRICTAIGIGVLSTLLIGCSASTTYDQGANQLEDLRVAIDDGTACPDLFMMLDAINEDSRAFSAAQGELINVGCYARDSDRNDEELEAQAPGSPWLGVPGEEIKPSSACDAAAAGAALETDSARAEPLIAATLDTCVSVNEWMSVLALHPGVMGMMDGYIPQLLDLQSACNKYVDTAVCQDALRLGLHVGN